MNLHRVFSLAIALCVAANPSLATLDEAINLRLLSEFGPYVSVEEANATLDKALAALVEQGGGVLVIPNDAPERWFPENTSQTAYNAPGVTIYDWRGGIERVYVPGAGARSSDGFRGGGSRITERHLYQNLPWQSVYSTQNHLSHYRGGSSSYMQYLSRPSVKGENSRIYVPTLRGLFVGQTLRVSGEPDGYGGAGDYITVKDLGLDGTDPYLVADTKHDHPERAIIYNKNVVNAMTLSDISNADNQSMSFIVDRVTYGIGDSFAVQASLTYQGGFMAGAGDEGGVVFAGHARHALDSFWGEVENWNADARELTYQPGGRSPQTLGMSRPIINLNSNKWITAGTVRIVAPGFGHLREGPASSSLVVGSADAGWDESVVGRFFAVDDPSEQYDAAEVGARGGPVRRWWHITGFERRDNGGFNLHVERMWWGAHRNAGPTLFRFENYSTSPDQEKPLAYIIAPGAWASDVRRGISGLIPGNLGIATRQENRTIVLAPTPQAGTRFDFEPGDPITQPPDPDVWLPTGFRMRHFNAYPGMMGGASFSAENLGRVQVGAGLTVAGPVGTLEEVVGKQKDGKPQFDAGLFILTATQDAIRLRGPVKEAAIDFWQYDGNVKPLRWRLPFDKAGRHSATLHVSPDNANLVFAGGQLDVSGQGTIRQAGLSATATPARNLRGINVAVPREATRLEVTFPANQPEADANYSIVVQPSWKTLDWVTAKTATGFSVEFSEPAPEGAKLDWQLIR